MADASLKAYKGNCHCGAFQFSITVPEIRAVTSCNCSLCSKKGYLAIFIPGNSLNVLKGDGTLVGYQFGDKKMTHKFCPICGTGIMIEFHSEAMKDRMNLNARTLQDVNPFSLELKPFDGAQRLQPPYAPPEFQGKIPDIELEGGEIYTGGCHCGAVTLAVKTKPLCETQVKEDNCSICQRNANTCIYPNKSQVSIDGENNITEYLFGRRFNGHCFCRTCGVHIYMKIHGPPREVFEKLPAERQEALRPQFELMPVRVRVLSGVNWGELRVERSDVGTGGYVVW